MPLSPKTAAGKALLLGSLCSTSYLGVYIARNILSAVTPQILDGGLADKAFIASLSSVYFIVYAAGQLINGYIGDKIKARYMISLGLIIAAVCNALMPLLIPTLGAHIIYGLTGFALAMVYGPMTKLVAENTEEPYTTRCSLGYTFASFLGSPLAGVLAALFVWQSVFAASSLVLLVFGVMCFTVFGVFEKRGLVAYGRFKKQESGALQIKLLFKRRIVRFTLIAVITGVVRTTVVFWLPTYLTEHLHFDETTASWIFTVGTFVISGAAFIAFSLYEVVFRRNLYAAIRAYFAAAFLCFIGAFAVENSIANVVFLIAAIVFSNCSAALLYSTYCPSLRDTGMVSATTGFLDFSSYIAAAASSVLFAHAADTIGWQALILVWASLMAAGVVTGLVFEKRR